MAVASGQLKDLLFLALVGVGLIAYSAWGFAVLYAVYDLYRNWRNASTAINDSDLDSSASLTLTLACVSVVGALVPGLGLMLQLLGLVWPYTAASCELKATERGFGGPTGSRRLLATAVWIQVATHFLLGGVLAVLAGAAASSVITHSTAVSTAYTGAAIALAAIFVTAEGAALVVPAARFSRLWGEPQSAAPAATSAI